MRTNVLVTGAAGCIGFALVRALVARRVSVRALALPGEDISKLESLGVEVRRGDLAASESIRGLADRIDTVFYLGGRVTDWGKRRIFYRDIYEATKNLLEESGGKVSRFVYVSSIAAFGMGRHLRGVRETDPIRKTGHPYNDAKCDVEHQRALSYGMDPRIILRVCADAARCAAPFHEAHGFGHGAR